MKAAFAVVLVAASTMAVGSSGDFDPAGAANPPVAGPSAAAIPSIVVTVPAAPFPFNPTLTVVGSGWQPGANINFVETDDSGGFSILTPTAPVVADGTGAFTANVPVSRKMGQPPATNLTDCAGVGPPGDNLQHCSLNALWPLSPSPSETASAPLTFAQSPFPGLDATPANGLLGGENVQVTGHGYPFPGTVRVVQCRVFDPADASLPEACDVTSFVDLTVQSGGTLSGSFPVKRILTIPSAPGGQVDCADKICALRGTDLATGEVATALLQFGRLTVTPSTGLLDLQVVNVHGDGYVPGNVVLVTQCKFGGQPPVGWFCERDRANTTDPNAGSFVNATVGTDGTFDITYVVKRNLPTWALDGNTPILYDCLVAATPCTINAGGGGLGDASITFSSPSVPAFTG